MYIPYYNYSQAYTFTQQYMLGDALLVRPIDFSLNTSTVNLHASTTATTNIASPSAVTVDVWIPPGEWLVWNSSALIQGPQIIAYPVSMAEFPRFVKAGSVLPFLDNLTLDVREAERIEWGVFLGDGEHTPSGQGCLYEDDGETNEYMDGAYATTCTTFVYQGKLWWK